MSIFSSRQTPSLTSSGRQDFVCLVSQLYLPHAKFSAITKLWNSVVGVKSCSHRVWAQCLHRICSKWVSVDCRVLRWVVTSWTGAPTSWGTVWGPSTGTWRTSVRPSVSFNLSLILTAPILTWPSVFLIQTDPLFPAHTLSSLSFHSFRRRFVNLLKTRDTFTYMIIKLTNIKRLCQ